MAQIDEIKKLAKENKLILGTERVMKSLKKGEIKNVGLSANCPDDLKADIDHYARLAKAKVIELNVPNDELGTICKKPFSISVLGY